MATDVIAIIPARIDSSRFPAKMIACETGKPLIEYAWKIANKASSVTSVFIATDSDEIAEVVRSFGGEVIMTGVHPNGTSRVAEAVRDLECDLVVNMQGDEPELDPSVIDAAVAAISEHQMGTAVCELQAQELENEHVVKAIVQDGVAIDFTRDATSESFRHIGLYVYKPEFLQMYVRLEPTQNELNRRLEQMRAIDHGYSIAVVKVDPQPEGIDTKEQYEEFVGRNQS